MSEAVAEDGRFRALPSLEDPQWRRFGGSKATLYPGHLERMELPRYFEPLLKALAQRRVLPVKEVCESLEFFVRVRRKLHASLVADLCCGHGLTGLLFALCERRVERVLLVDRRCPDNFEGVFAAVCEVGPWVREKVEFQTRRLRGLELEAGSMVVAVHACGLRTDRALDVAMLARGHAAVLPCCYPAAHCRAPQALGHNLGVPTAMDVDRTYRLESAGYRVRWDSIPAVITPMNRLLIARAPRD